MITIRKVAIVVSVTIRTAIMVAVAIGIVLGMGRSYQKICAASLVDPNTVGIESPGRSLSANRMASLPFHGYAPARIGGASSEAQVRAYCAKLCAEAARRNASIVKPEIIPAW
jgi:hypothetical protein